MVVQTGSVLLHRHSIGLLILELGPDCIDRLRTAIVTHCSDLVLDSTAIHRGAVLLLTLCLMARSRLEVVISCSWRTQ